jgi:4a-hydroxytetrahydrobiopterin dehydratase
MCAIIATYARGSEEAPVYTSIIRNQDTEIWLGHCPGWVPTCEGEILRIYHFGSFKEAIEFVDEISVIAQTALHYPDIAVQGPKVTLRLKTHPVHGLTEKDFEFVQRVEELPYTEVELSIVH